jgi:DNA (cytosine-5)-methyltransferase 1
MTKLRVLDLFSGIGGFSLGLERTGGFETVAFCEIEPFPRKVLAKHWPGVPCYDDVRTLTAERLAADGIAVDVICGGFPCQDISTAGNGAGLAGARSGLWSEIARLVGELRPSYVIVENVAALLGRGLGAVLGDLAAIGYDAEWHCIPASHVGAPHRRDRIWIMAHPANDGWARRDKQHDRRVLDKTGREQLRSEFAGSGADCRTEALADATSQRQQGQGQPIQWSSQAPHGEGQANKSLSIRLGGVWPTEPELGRVANGIPDRSHRLKGLGNAVVPEVVTRIGTAILEQTT